MLLSRKCVYALRAVLYVAQHDTGAYVPIGEISENLKISFHFLTKILQILTQNQIMISYRGPSGGINLAKSANDITVLDIIYIIDGDKKFKECILGLPDCIDTNPCALHETWTSYCQSLKNELSNMTIKDLVLDIKESNLRISGR